MAHPHAILRDRAHQEAHQAALVVRRHGDQRRSQLVRFDADGVADAVAVAAAAAHYADMVQALHVDEPHNATSTPDRLTCQRCFVTGSEQLASKQLGSHLRAAYLLQAGTAP